MGYKRAHMTMSERTITQIIETEKDGISTVQVVSTDEDGGKYVGVSSYAHDTWHTSDDREDAYKNATEESLNK